MLEVVKFSDENCVLSAAPSELLDSFEVNFVEDANEKFIDKKSLVKLGNKYIEVIDVILRFVNEFTKFTIKLLKLDITPFRPFRFKELKVIEKLKDVILLSSNTRDLEAHEITPVFTFDRSM